MKCYRLNHKNEGLWYNDNGEFTGLINTKYTFCKANSVLMPFREELKNTKSIVTSLEELFNWFPKEDIIKLYEFGYTLDVYEINFCDINFNSEFNHFFISSEFKPIYSLTLNNL